MAKIPIAVSVAAMGWLSSAIGAAADVQITLVCKDTIPHIHVSIDGNVFGVTRGRDPRNGWDFISTKIWIEPGRIQLNAPYPFDLILEIERPTLKALVHTSLGSTISSAQCERVDFVPLK